MPFCLSFPISPVFILSLFYLKCNWWLLFHTNLHSFAWNISHFRHFLFFKWVGCFCLFFAGVFVWKPGAKSTNGLLSMANARSEINYKSFCFAVHFSFIHSFFFFLNFIIIFQFLFMFRRTFIKQIEQSETKTWKKYFNSIETIFLALFKSVVENSDETKAFVVSLVRLQVSVFLRSNFLFCRAPR